MLLLHHLSRLLISHTRDKHRTYCFTGSKLLYSHRYLVPVTIAPHGTKYTSLAIQVVEGILTLITLKHFSIDVYRRQILTSKDHL